MTEALRVTTALVCDQVLRDAMTRKWTLIGVFDRVAVERFPSPPTGLGVYFRLEGLAGPHSWQIALVFGGASVMTSSPMQIKPEGTQQLAGYLGLQTFPGPGRYAVDLLIDGKKVASAGFVVEQRRK